MNPKTAALLAAVALGAIAAWPAFTAVQRDAPAPSATMAPVIADYLSRGRIVAFYEAAVRRHPDQIVTRMLAQQYLMRYRETGDVGDLLRAESAAARSLREQPRLNINAELALASVDLSLHKFLPALAHAREALRIQPDSVAARAQVASIDMELGRYDEAARLLASARRTTYEDAATDTALARYDELTGKIDDARLLIERAARQTDSVVDNPAEARAWYHFRLGELAFTAGDGAAAERRFREALDIYPAYARAHNGLAKLYWTQRRWPEALAESRTAADLVPLPETLGYKADALRALGDLAGARETDALIVAIERIGNAQRINDRALAIYYADHRIRLDDALRIARRDKAVRDDIYAEDTLAWTLAQVGRWGEAQVAARKALRFGTQDARLMYHAAVIFEHTGHVDEGRRLMRAALVMNAQFHPYFAEAARRGLSG